MPLDLGGMEEQARVVRVLIIYNRIRMVLGVGGVEVEVLPWNVALVVARLHGFAGAEEGDIAAHGSLQGYGEWHLDQDAIVPQRDKLCAQEEDAIHEQHGVRRRLLLEG